MYAAPTAAAAPGSLGEGLIRFRFPVRILPDGYLPKGPRECPMALTYSDAGVDLDRYEEAMQRLPDLVKRTHTPRMMPLPGGFAGLYRLFGDSKRYDDPVLVSGTDGVGTKIKVAQAAHRLGTIGVDLVAMCVNDCLCCGAEPLFFLDYLAIPKDDPDLVASVVAGVADGCLESGAALLGGETAVMPDLYREGEFDLAGFAVGVVDRAKLIDGSGIAPGQVVLGVPSSGLHSNGFSLVRKIVFDHAGLSLGEQPAGLDGTVADVLLEPTRIYASDIARLRELDDWGGVRGIAHITGGGLEENLGRVLPDGCVAAIDWDAWQRPVVFKWLQHLGEVDEAELRRVFNCGIGLAVVVEADRVDDVKSALPDAFAIGTIEAG